VDEKIKTKTGTVLGKLGSLGDGAEEQGGDCLQMMM